MSQQHPESLPAADLATATGGMNTDGFRRSTNIEDRRTPEGVAADTAWWNSLHPAAK